LSGGRVDLGSHRPPVRGNQVAVAQPLHSSLAAPYGPLAQGVFEVESAVRAAEHDFVKRRPCVAQKNPSCQLRKSQVVGQVL
jgi:hypothetical protein